MLKARQFVQESTQAILLVMSGASFEKFYDI
ncbi:MAG: hypothetical protein ACJA2P_001976 [Rhodoferax sp.]|jgi:hypothetical protein